MCTSAHEQEDATDNYMYTGKDDAIYTHLYTGMIIFNDDSTMINDLCTYHITVETLIIQSYLQ